MKTSIKNKFLFAILIISYTLIVCTPVFLWILFIRLFQKTILVKQDTILFTPPFSGLLFSSLIFILFGIMLCVLFFEVISFKCKTFKEFFSKKGMKIDSKEKFNSEISQVLKLILIIFLVSLPILFLCFNNYYYVTSDEFHYNSFFSLSEEEINLNNLIKVELGLYASHYKGNKEERTANLHYILVFATGKSYNLREAPLIEKVKLDDYLIQKGIPKIIKFIDEDSLKYVKEKGDTEWGKNILKILEID